LPAEVLYEFLFPPMRATCANYLISLNLIILIIFGRYRKCWSYPLHNCPHPRLTSPP
jgi:hypothetical protein